MPFKSYPSISRPGLKTTKQGWVQDPPYTIPAPYYTNRFEGLQNGVPYGAAEKCLSPITSTSEAAKAYAKAYDKLTNKMRSEFTVNLGETVGEGRKALTMAAARVMQITRAYSHLRQGNLRSMLREFGFSKTRRGQTWVRVGKGGKKFSLKHEKVRLSESDIKRKLKTPASLWLEYKLGWDPIVRELYNSLRLAHDVHPSHFNTKVSVTGKYVDEWVWRESYYASGFDVIFIHEQRTEYRVKLKLDARISEPLKRRFVEYGVVNPALIAWNLTPGTMFIDWFLPVSTYLDSFTAFYGVKLSDMIRTDKRNCQIKTHFSRTNRLNPSWVELTTEDQKASFFQRSYSPGTVNLKVPSLMDRTGTGFSSPTSGASRAATAVSVLINLLRK